MNKISNLIFILFFLSCQGQKDNVSEDDNNTKTVKEELTLRNDNKSILERYIERFVDSLNNTVTKSDLPQFLSDSQFDYRHRGIWISFHNPISIRAQIINRVNNCKTLLLIIQSDDQAYKKKPMVEDNLRVPLSESSFYDLVLLRSRSLECKGN